MPARKPTRLKVLKGTAQPCRTNKREPKLPVGAPDRPDHLSETAAAHWTLLSRLLLEMGVLTKTDRAVLEAACETYADLRAARAEVRAFGTLTYETTTEKGGTMYRAHPSVALASDADRRYAGYLSKLGLTPADRSRVSTVDGAEDADPWGALASQQ